MGGRRTDRLGRLGRLSRLGGPQTVPGVSTPGHGKGEGPGGYKLFGDGKHCFLTPNDAGDNGTGRSAQRARSPGKI